MCPRVTPGLEYVIMCYQDLENGRLRLQEDCVAQEWDDDSNWPRLVKVGRPSGLNQGNAKLNYCLAYV